MKKSTKRPAQGGRPSSYRPECARLAFHLTLLGATDSQVAEALEVSERTINEWKQAHPEFSQSLKGGKIQADARVAGSLFNRAVGYSHEETDVRAVALGNNEGSRIVKTKITRHYPPDVTACIFWLKNRNPKLWRDRVDHSLANPDGSNLIPEAEIEKSRIIAEFLYQKSEEARQKDSEKSNHAG